MIARIWTDGSYDGPSKTCAWAFLVKMNNDAKIFHSDQGTDVPKGAEEHWNIAGECMAVIKALEWAERCAYGFECENVVITYDYEGIGKWIKGEWKARKPFTQWFVKEANTLIAELKAKGYKGIHVNLVWTKGHAGNSGNEEVDGLAKSAMIAERDIRTKTVPIEERACFTGRRPEAVHWPEDGNPTKDQLYTDETRPSVLWVKDRLRRAIALSIQHGYRMFVSGGALGTDTWAAEEVLTQIDSGAEARLVIAQPFHNQADRWRQPAQDRYTAIKARAGYIHTCSKKNPVDKSEARVKNMARNGWMVDNASLVIAVWDSEKSGGTWDAIKKAHSAGKRILVINYKDHTFGWYKEEAKVLA